jgi:ACT domain-containing protein
LLRDGRLLRLHFDIPDRPGMLADISARIAALGGTVIEVQHQQLFGAPTVQSTELHLMVEVRDGALGEQIIAALEGNRPEANVGMVKVLRAVYSLSPALARSVMARF